MIKNYDVGDLSEFWRSLTYRGNKSGDGKMQCGKALGYGEAHKKVWTAALLQRYVWGSRGHLWGFGEQIGLVMSQLCNMAGKLEGLRSSNYHSELICSLGGRLTW